MLLTNVSVQFLGRTTLSIQALRCREIKSVDEHPFDVLIERIADTVVRKIQEQQQIDAVARAVIAYMNRQGQSTASDSAADGAAGETCVSVFAAPPPDVVSEAPEVTATAAPPATDGDSLPEEQGAG